MAEAPRRWAQKRPPTTAAPPPESDDDDDGSEHFSDEEEDEQPRRVATKSVPMKRPPKYAMKSFPSKRPPAPQQNNNDDDDDEDEDEDDISFSSDEDAPAPMRPSKRPVQMQSTAPGSSKNANKDDENQDEDNDDLDKDEDEDEDEDIDDEEDEELDDDDEIEGEKRPAKRTKRNLFIEEEAEVDEDEDDEIEDDEDLGDDFIDEANEAEAMQPAVYRKLDTRRDEEDDMDAVEQRLKERYGRGAYSVGAYRGDVDYIPMQFLLPTERDPKLWLVKCKPGKERFIAMNMMRKYIDYQDSNRPLRIKSIVTRDNLKGYLYVEARSMADVQIALEKVNNVYLSKIVMVGLDEMVSVMTIKKPANTLKPGSWVRFNRGKFKGDLAQVLEILETNDMIRVKVIPRIDFSDNQDGDRKRKAQVRPPQKLFNPKDANTKIKNLSKGKGGYWIYGNEFFDKNGFMEKEVKLVTLDTENVSPTLEELAKFSGSTDGDQLDLTALADKTKIDAVQFQPGDFVTITQGDLQNAQGTVQSVEKSYVVLRMKDEALGEIQIEPTSLSRSYQLGDHVKVIRGKHKDETGMITQIDGSTISIFCDSTSKQFSVFMKDVQSVAEVSGTPSTMGGYSLHDFVQLGPDTVAVIIQVDRDQYRIIDQHGVVRVAKAQEITQKRDSKRAIAIDANQHTIQANDVVEVISGEYIGKQATILHLYRTWVFLQSKEFPETAGVFVVRTRMVNAVNPRSSDGFRMPPPPRAGPGPQMRGGFGGGFGGGGRGRGGRDELIHQTVVITSGPYKGYQGIVKDVTDKGARVELHTNAKIVTVTRDKLRLPNEPSRPARSVDRFSGAATPLVGAKTPNPYAGAATPAWDAGSKTPAWDAAGGRTPAWDAAGGRTPAWDSGARTPAWNAGGGRTPAWDSGARTPARPSAPSWDSNFQTPRAAETPARDAAPSRGNNWLAENLEVVIRESALGGKHCVILAVQDGGRQARVRLLDNGETMTLDASRLGVVRPAKRDKCQIIAGSNQGKTGVLAELDLDQNDAIVQLDNNDYSVERLENVCKLHK